MFSQQPLVSVLLPFYKPGKWFSRAIDSILNQTYANRELVLVDNNDEHHHSSKLAEQYSLKNDQVHVIVEKESGITNALNTGIGSCYGKYIARMDADDFSEPDRLSLQVEFLEKHEHIGVVSGMITYDSEVENQGMKLYVDQLNSIREEHEIFELRFVESPFAHPSVMMRSELFKKFGTYSKEPGIPEDYELWLRWLEQGVRMSKIPFPVLTWMDHPSRLSRINSNYSPDAFDKIRYRYLSNRLKSRQKPQLPIWIWGGGRYSRKKVRLLQDHGIEIHGFIDVKDDRKIGGYPILNYKNLPPPGEFFVVSMVSNRGKWKEVKNYLETRGYSCEKNFIIAG